MKLFQCLFVVTTVSSYRTTNNNWNPHNQPPLTRRNSGYSVYENAPRNVPFPHFNPHHRLQEPNQLTKKIHNLKNIPIHNTGEKHLRGKQEFSSNDWIPISPSVTVNRNSYQLQPQEDVFHYSRRGPIIHPSNPVSSPTFNHSQQPSITEPVRFQNKNNQPQNLDNQSAILFSSQNNGFQQIPQQQQQEQYQQQYSALTLFQVPPSTSKNIQNSITSNSTQDKITGSPVRPTLKPTSLQQNSRQQRVPQQVLNQPRNHSQSKQFQNPVSSQFKSSNSAINKPQVIFDPFRTNRPAFSAQQISPIFAQMIKQTNPESERKAFLKNFNIDQFLEQQKVLRPAQTQSLPETIGNNASPKYFEASKTAKEDYDPEEEKRDYSTLQKNYRDDKLHEPSSEAENERDNEQPEVEREEDEKAPRVRQETPQDIPTKPIYPGEGKWAKPGLKHRPYIRQNPYDEVKDTLEKPLDGYDTFLKGDELFNIKRDKFHSQFNQLPVNHKLGQFLESGSSMQNFGRLESKPVRESQADETKVEEEEEEGDGDDEEEDDEDEFVPTKLYAQVRHSESEEHLPSDEAEEGRLKEVVRDSKIQTVYTEEGFEDIGYDHAGHEKHAESDEGYGEKERKIHKVDEKRVPQKTILRESSGYNDENELISDEEIKADKAALGIPDDAHSAESQFGDVPGVNIVESPKKKKNKKKKKNNGMGKKQLNRKDFMSTKEIKTMTTKDKDDGNMDVEIIGEVKVIIQPNNSSKSHQFVKKLPTVHKVMKTGDTEEIVARVQEISPANNDTNNKKEIRTDFYIEEIFPDIDAEKIITTTYTSPEIESLEIPVTTSPTTAIPKISPKNSQKELIQIDEQYSNKRRKRFANDFPQLNVDTEFISKITHEIDTPKPDLTFVKYPYYKKYNELGLHENSPLRYAEDLKNIPKKEEGKMAFYEQAESRITCPEIASTVEPIPERVLNAEQHAEEEDEEDESENQTDYDEDEEGQESHKREVHEHPKTPRLNGLGDAIDCMKTKYFGENPLDSPFFKEDTVGPVLPIFNFGIGSNKEKSQVGLSEKALGTVKNQSQSQVKAESQINDQVVETNNIQTQRAATQKSTQSESGNTTNSEKRFANNRRTNDNFFNDTQSTESIDITKSKNKIELRPNNIYDQIRLLDLYPESTNETLNGIVEPPPQAEKLEVWGSTLLDSVRIPRKIDKDKDEAETDPVSAALKRRRRIHMKPKPIYSNFSRNKYIPVTSYPVSEHYRPQPTTDVPPKNKVHSEVYYKNNINPKEQMNVFTDILNNIRTSSENNIDNFDKKDDPVANKYKKQQLKYNTPPLKTSTTKATTNDIYAQDSYLQAYKNPDNDLDISKQTTWKPSNKAQPTTYEVTEPSTQLSKDTVSNNKKRLIIYLPSTQNTISKLSTSTHKPKIPKVSSTTRAPHLNFVPTVRSISLVREMLPPKPSNHMPVYKRDNKIFETNQEDDTADKIINKFIVIGMKPPPLQKVYGYNEFYNKYSLRKRKYPKRRTKRSTGRSYASVTRRRGQTDESEIATTTTEGNDDYVPHRSRNFYYDEKKGKIVYLNQNKKNEEEEEIEEELPVEVQYEEVTEGRKNTKSTTPKQNPIFATATPPPQGQSYIDFVKKLKSASNYHEIPDPVSTEASQVVTTTLKPVSTEAPDFLSILKKLHSDSTYKIIEDPDEKKSKKKPTTTAEPLEEELEEEEDEEDSYTKIKNSFGGDIHEIGENFKIFDITEYIPKIKNYMPKTKVDTSRYKTIERVTQATTILADEEIGSTTGKEIIPLQTSPVSIGSVKESTFKIIMEEPSAIEQPEVVREESSSMVLTTTLRSTPEPIETTRKPQIIRSRGRRPARTTITTTSPISSTESIRKNNRRRLTRPRSRTTTEKYLDDAEDSSTKVLRRRSDIEGAHSEKDRNGGVNVNKVKNEEKQLKDVQGLYNQFIRRRKIASNKNAPNRFSDSEAKQSSTSSTDNGSAKKEIEIVKKYDHTKRHGGNYRKLTDDTNNNGDKEILTDNLSKSSKVNKDIEIISEYDKSKKHGGNYRSENDEGYTITEQDVGEGVIISNDKTSVVTERKDSLDQVVTKLNNKPVRISLWSDTHNLEEQPTTQTPHVVPSKPKRFNGKIRKKNSRKPVTRLTDIVPKPEMFYTDPNLPLAVNLLIDSYTLSSDETAKIVSSTENNQETVANISDVVKLKTINNADFKLNNSFTTASTLVDVSKTDVFTSESSRETISTTKKPVFIKDPSKRFYFYAPV